MCDTYLSYVPVSTRFHSFLREGTVSALQRVRLPNITAVGR